MDAATVDEIKTILQKACDRSWEDETLFQTAVIAANAIYWRDRDIAILKAKLAAAAPSVQGGREQVLTEMLNRIANAYGSLPQGKKNSTGAVGLAINQWLNYRRGVRHDEVHDEEKK